MNKIPVSAVILTYNEELNLRNCLQSICDLVDEIIIVDSFSTDNTIEIAEEFNSIVYQNKFETHSKQWKWAIEHTDIKNDWVLGLDSDQSVSDNLKEELRNFFKSKIQSFDGIYVRRKQIFMGKWIKYGGYYPKYLLKAFRKDKVKIDDNELLDHHFYVQKNTKILESDIIENNLKEKDLSFWFQKHIRYAELLAKEEISSSSTRVEFVENSPDKRTKLLKNIYSKLPLFIRPFIYFIWRYFFQLGFLDGTKGFVFHFFHALCFRFMVDAKIYELRKQ